MKLKVVSKAREYISKKDGKKRYIMVSVNENGEAITVVSDVLVDIGKIIDVEYLPRVVYFRG